MRMSEFRLTSDRALISRRPPPPLTLSSVDLAFLPFSFSIYVTDYCWTQRACKGDKRSIIQTSLAHTNAHLLSPTRYLLTLYGESIVNKTKGCQEYTLCAPLLLFILLFTVARFIFCCCSSTAAATTAFAHAYTLLFFASFSESILRHQRP